MATLYRLRIAAIATAYYKLSHADVIISRWLKPLPSDRAHGWPAYGHEKPRTEIVSAHIVQCLENDIGQEVVTQHGVPLFPTIRDALMMGGDALAVDGVLLIGEHGEYPFNEYGQKTYPRRELFDEIVAVFRETGRTVPVFSDKHFSYDADSARHMVATAKEMGFPLMGGSSIPLAGLGPEWNMPDGLELDEALSVYYHLPETYGYHSVELLQSVVANRAGGESGIEAVTSYYDESFWEAEAEGIWPRDLMQAALAASPTVKPGDYRTNVQGQINERVWPHKWPTAFVFEHRDGLRTIYLQLHGHVSDWSVAVRAKNGEIYAGSSSNANCKDGKFAPHFAVLNSHIEEFFLTGKTPYPIEFYLRNTLAIHAALHALKTPGVRVPVQDS
jgi:hypothetical protein